MPNQDALQRQRLRSFKLLIFSILAGVALILIILALRNYLEGAGFGCMVMVMACAPFFLAMFYKGDGFVAAMVFNASCYCCIIIVTAFFGNTPAYSESLGTWLGIILGAGLLLYVTNSIAWMGYVIRLGYDNLMLSKQPRKANTPDHPKANK